MVRNILLIFFTLLALPACAATIHPAVQMHIDEARSMCEPDFGKFTFDEKTGLRIVDLNNDGRDDYIISTAGYQCSDAASLFSGSGGYTHYIVVSQPGGDGSLYATDESSILAYDFTVDTTKKPAVIVFEGRCPNGTDGTHTGKFNWSWKDGKMQFISTGEGCNG